MPSIRLLRIAFVLAVAIACGEGVLAPSPDALTGRWSAAPLALSPRGQLLRTLEFTADGRYARTTASRGVYPQLPADSIGSITREYGTYVLRGDTLRFAQDSARTRDWLGGEYFQVGPPRGYIEGPPTDPVVEITSTRLTLRYMVNPGDRYVAVVAEYLRER